MQEETLREGEYTTAKGHKIEFDRAGLGLPRGTVREYLENRFPYEGKYYNQLSFHDRMAFRDMLVHTVALDADRVKKSDILWLFLAVNNARVPQTEEHIARAQKLYEEALEKETKE